MYTLIKTSPKEKWVQNCTFDNVFTIDLIYSIQFYWEKPQQIFICNVFKFDFVAFMIKALQIYMNYIKYVFNKIFIFTSQSTCHTHIHSQSNPIYKLCIFFFLTPFRSICILMAIRTRGNVIYRLYTWLLLVIEQITCLWHKVGSWTHDMLIGLHSLHYHYKEIEQSWHVIL